MAIFKKLDWWSIMDGLDKMIDYDYNGNEKESIYWDFYLDQITELCDICFSGKSKYDIAPLIGFN